MAFEDESSVEQAVAKHYHMIKDKRVNIFNVLNKRMFIDYTNISSYVFLEK